MRSFVFNSRPDARVRDIQNATHAKYASFIPTSNEENQTESPGINGNEMEYREAEKALSMT